MSTIVGALAVELGLDTAEFEKGLKGVVSSTNTHMPHVSAQIKRSAQEGAESLRLLDEAFGIHISRPIAKILTQEFPGLAKGFQSMLGAGVALGVGVAAFEFISSAIEKLQKKFEEARKAQEEYEASARHLSATLQDVALSHEKRLTQLNAELAALSGDKQGALADRIKVASIEDAQLAIQEIDKIAEAMERAAKAALEAETASHRFWLAVANDNSSEHNLTIAEASRNFDDFKEKLKEASKQDATAGTRVGLDLAIQKAKDLDDQLTHALSHRISDSRSTLDDAAKAFKLDDFSFGLIGTHSGFTDKEIAQLRSQDEEAKKFVETQKAVTAEHEKHVKLLKLQNETTADIGEKEIEKLKAETSAQIALANATGQSAAQQTLQQAAGEADQLISRIQEEAHGRLTKAMKEELLTVHALTAERDVAKAGVQTNQDLDKEIDKIKRQIEANKQLAAAYLEGGVAIQNARIDERLSAQIQDAAKARDRYNELKKAVDSYADSLKRLDGAAGPKQGLNISPEGLAAAKTEADNADRKVAIARAESLIEDETKYQTEINQTSKSLAEEQPLLDQLNEAYTQNAQAVRQAQNALALFHWEQAHPGPTVAEAQATLANPSASAAEQQAAQTRINQIQQVSVALEQQSINAQRAADAQLASRYSISKTYDDEIARLERAKEVLQSYGDSTLAIDAAIYDERQRALKQWDDAAFKVGSFGDKYQAVMNEVALKGQEASQKMAQAWLSAIDDVNTELAKMATGQKFDFRHIVLQLAQEQTKGELEKAEGWLAQQFGIKIPGLEGKPDGSSSKPLHVTFGSQTNSNTSANPLDAAAKQISSGGGFFSRIGSGLENLLHSHQATQEKNKDVLKVTVGNIVPTMVTNWPQSSPSAGSIAGGLSGTRGAAADPAQSLFKAGTDLDKASQPLTKAGTDTDKAAQSLSKAATDLSGAAQSLKSSGGGGSAGTGSIFSGGDSGSASESSAPDFSDFADAFDFGGGLASGGSVRPGTHYMVGEKGPELFRSATAGSIIPNSALTGVSGPHNWTFDPHAAYAQPYEAYERKLHQGTNDGGWWKALLGLGGSLLTQKLGTLFSHHPTADSTATSAGGKGTLEGGGFGFGIGADANPNFAAFGPASVAAGRAVPSLAGFGLGSDAPTIPPMTKIPDQQTASYFNLSLDGFRAAGGPVSAGATYMVGERGPELFHAPGDGHIIPNHMLSSMPNFAGFMADGGDVFSGNSYMVGERGPEMYQVPGVSNVSNSSRGGDTHHHNITQNNYGHQEDSDLFERTSHQKLKRLSHP